MREIVRPSYGDSGLYGHKSEYREMVFESYTEFIEYAYVHGKYRDGFWAEKDNIHGGNSWYGDNGPAHAKQLAETGWTEGRRAVRAIANKLDLQGRIHKPEVMFDVVGDGGFDMGRVMAGQPESAMYFSETERYGISGNILKVVIDVMPLYSIKPEIIKLRGAAVLALCDGLESIGKRLEIDAIWFQGSSEADQLTIPLKRAEQSAQEDQIAFALAHSAFPRRYCLSVTQNGHMRNQERYPADIYLPPLLGYGEEYNIWTNQASAIAWVEQQLTKFGVELESEY